MSISPSSSGSYYPKATSSNEQASSSNSSSQSRPSSSFFPIMHEDILPHNRFITSGEVDSIDLKEGTISLKVSKKDAKRMDIILARHLVKEGMSGAALEECRKISSPYETIKIQTTALQQQKHSYDVEFQYLDKKVQEGKASKEEKQRYAEVINKRQEFTQHVVNSAAKERALKEKWDIQIEKYHRFIRDFLKNINQKTFDKVYETFYLLRALNPQSSDPFFPLFLCPYPFPKEFLQEALKEWYEIQPHLACGIVFTLTVRGLDLDQSIKKDVWQEIAQLLKKFYPKNVMLLTKLEEMSGEEAFRRISHCLTKGINLIRLRKFEETANFLSNQRSYFEGWAFWYRYLALTLALNDNLRAFAAMAKSLLLPDIEEDEFVPSTGMFERLLSAGKKCFQFPEIEAFEIKSKPKPDPLLKFMRVIQDKSKPEKIVDSINDFIKECSLCFENGNFTKNLPFIYFGVHWLASHIPMDKDSKKLASIFESLFELLSCCTSIMFDFEYNDPWFLETFELNPNEKGGVNVVADFSNMHFDFETIELPEIQLEGVELGVDSQRVILITLAKQLHQLIMSVMVNPSFQDVDWDFSNFILHLPNSVSIFMNKLDHGFRMGVQKLGYQNLAFKNAKYWLEIYLKASDKSYDLEDSFIEWAKFALVSCSDSDKVIDYIPENFENHWMQFQGVVKSLKLIPNRDIDRLCLRDALNSQILLTELADKISYSSDDSVYSCFERFQNMFGWNLAERFEVWGERLLRKRRYGNDHFINNEPPLHRSLLNFWIEFYQKTVEKNHHIAGGGDEDSNQRLEWGHDEDYRNLWFQIIRDNSPELYPNYKGLVTKNKIALQEIVKNKHDHGNEVVELRGIYNKIRNQGNIPVLMAAALLRAALYERSGGVHHSVYVETEEEARQIYQILLNVFVDRLIRYRLISLGYSNWTIETLSNPESFFGEILAPLIGAFHGPETHITGNGPIQNHYNAGIVIPGGSVINTHIYYGP